MSKTIRGEEREQFDSKVSRLYNGDALAAVAEALRISSDVFPPQGSFSNLLAIFAEEVEKARVKLASFPSPDYQRGQEEMRAVVNIIEEYLAVLDGGSIPKIGAVKSKAPICDKDPYRSYVGAVLDKLRGIHKPVKEKP